MFHESLKRHRLNAGLTQVEVAKEIGISPRAYQHYETGTREPNITALIKFADLFDISLDELIGRTFPKDSLVDSEQVL